MPLLTAIIPTFNRAAFLSEALDALERQTRPVDEIIVWDDGSTDGTLEAVQQRSKSVKCFRSENGGKSRALNAALAEARGDYIWICDDDDLALPNAAETLCGLLDRNADAGIAGGAYRRFRDGPEGRQEQGPGYWPDLAHGPPIRHILEDIFLFQNATLVRREVYDRAGPFREDLPRSIDYDMIVRLGLLAPIVLTEEVIFLQRKHDGDRGPAVARHAADRSDTVWRSADLDVFHPFRSRIPMAFYESFFDTADPELAHRAALLQRACIYARRTDWTAALEDLRSAAETLPTTRLSTVERAILQRLPGGKHGIAPLSDPAIRAELLRFAGSGALAGQIGQAIARGMSWRVKRAVRGGAWREGLSHATLMLRLARRRGSPLLEPADIAERRTLPASAYAGTPHL